MTNLLIKCGTVPKPLVDSLRDVLNQGLVDLDGCILLRAQAAVVDPIVRKDFPDKTGFECFVNHIHLEGYLTESRSECCLLEQALAFGRELSHTTAQCNILAPILYVIAGEKEEVNIRFHILRHEEQWLSNDIEGYEEAVAAFELQEMIQPFGRDLSAG